MESAEKISTSSDIGEEANDVSISSENKLKDSRKKHLDYILKKIELFTHFMNKSTKDRIANNMRDNDSSETEAVVDSSSTAVVGSEGIKPGDLEDADGNIKVFEYVKCTPKFIINGNMRDYQIRGLNWLISLHENGLNGILADEMGLGKTLQTISLLGYLKHVKHEIGPYLIMVPLSTLTNWQRELESWCPSLDVITMYGSWKDRKSIIAGAYKDRKWDICLATYEIVLRQPFPFIKLKWRYIIIDEGQRIKNDKSKLSQTIRKLKSIYRLIITGTPFQNNLHELWALLNFLLPEYFNSSEDFDAWFKTRECLNNELSCQMLKDILKPLVLRRLKINVETSLLPKKEIKVFVSLSKMQRELYRKILLKDFQVQNEVDGSFTRMRLDNLLMHLRKCTNHPYLFQGMEPGPPYKKYGDHLIQNSGKLMVLDKLLAKLKSQGSRILLFLHFHKMMDILEDYFTWREYKYHRLDGKCDYAIRTEQIDEFNSPNSSTFIFMLNTRAGGLGINLHSSDVVIFYDIDWNPQADLQATDRAHRIGQTKQVRVFRLITENTIEEKMDERADLKLCLNQKIMKQGYDRPDKTEMLSMVRFCYDKIVTSNDKELTDEDIDTILKRGEAKTVEKIARIDNLAKCEWSTTLHDFEGENYEEKRRNLQKITCPAPTSTSADAPTHSRLKTNLNLGAKSSVTDAVAVDYQQQDIQKLLSRLDFHTYMIPYANKDKESIKLERCSIEEDRFLLYQLSKMNLNDPETYDKLHLKVTHTRKFSETVRIKSLSKQKLKNHCQSLIQLILNNDHGVSNEKKRRLMS